MQFLTKEERAYVDKYKLDTQVGPFAVQFITADALVTWRGKILMVERRGPLGRGQIAMPGGFVNENEYLIDGAIRECFEEAGVTLKKEWMTASKVVDDPNRSPLGRVVTHVFEFDIPHHEKVVLKAGDDASRAFFLDRDKFEASESIVFQDHYKIIVDMFNAF